EIMPDNVEYLGIVHGEELRHLLVNSTALVMPSLWYENQPFSILEAFACEKPVIASDLGGMKELVVHLERGILVPPADASALAEAMLSIAESPQEVSRMGANAREYAVAHHHPNVHYHRLMDIYAQVV
ncbi:MAG: glycosyltransferase family 4 protein, partial [Anaerolineales bacterium]